MMTDKQKKIVFVMSYILVFVIGLMFGAIKKDDSTVQSSSNQIAQSTTNNQTTKPVSTTAIQAVTADPMKNINDTLVILQEAMKDVCSVSLDTNSEVYNLIPTESQFVTDVLSAQAGNANAIKEWNDMVTTFKETSISVFQSTGYSIVILNPSNTANMLLCVTNGTVVYDFIAD